MVLAGVRKEELELLKSMDGAISRSKKCGDSEEDNSIKTGFWQDWERA